MTNYALIENGTVINMIVWDGDTETWNPGAGVETIPLVPGVAVGIGYTWDGSLFTAPPVNDDPRS
ncbi:hypothetical protein [Paraburkholderia graminis]|uniref:hypothetical protein n=1 Tax=Paraburkholderia graminis TaxID=60548 RepID=UPI0038B89562